MAYKPLRLAENIVLLRRRCNKPLPPTKNELPEDRDSLGRIFTLRQELDIVGCLTYLSAYSKESDRVTALCMEECADHNGLIVSFATNTGSTQHLLQGMQGIVELLEQQAKDPRQQLLDSLLMRVLANARPRLVRRLGLRQVPNTSDRLRDTTAARLQRALECYKEANGNTVTASNQLCKLSDDISRLSDQYNQATSHGNDAQSDSILISILGISSQLWSSHREELDRIFHSIPARKIEPNRLESLMSRLGHIGHYVPSTTRLIQFAQGHSIFQSIKLRTVYIAPHDLSQYLSEPNHGSQMNGGLRLGERNIASWHDEARTKVQQHHTQKGYKVHAEIQLLIYYEQRDNVVYPPRVLKSSKDACFLCDLFIQTHGRYYIPKTHGKVYDLWMLPDIDSLMMHKARRKLLHAIVDRFNNTVEELLLRALTDKMPRLSDPRESGIFSLASFVMQGSTTSKSSSVLHLKSPRSLSPIHVNDDSRPTGRQLGPSQLSSGSLDAPVGVLLDDQIPLLNSFPQSAPPVTQGTPHDMGTLSSSSATPSQSTTPRPQVGKIDSPHTEFESQELESKYNPSMAKGSMVAPSRKPSFSEQIELQPGIPQYHTFGPVAAPIRFHTTKVHIELSRAQASELTVENPLDLDNKESKDIHIEALWLDTTQLSKIIAEGGHMIDLAKDWQTMNTPEGILFTPHGLLIRKKSHIIWLKGIHKD